MTTPLHLNRSTHAPLPVRLVRGLEHNDALDDYEAVPQRAADVLLADDTVRGVLHGDWLGHALHPLLTDLPLGAWMSTSILDLTGGPKARDAATRLLTFGVVAAIPTALTGLAEWGRTSSTPVRRVGLVHAGLNTFVLAMYAGSLVARRRGRHRLGVVLALGGGVGATVSGYLGGHLSIARKVGTRDEEFAA
jgi:uncharacterized membrane protein